MKTLLLILSLTTSTMALAQDRFSYECKSTLGKDAIIKTCKISDRLYKPRRTGLNIWLIEYTYAPETIKQALGSK